MLSIRSQGESALRSVLEACIIMALLSWRIVLHSSLTLSIEHRFIPAQTRIAFAIRKEPRRFRASSVASISLALPEKQTQTKFVSLLSFPSPACTNMERKSRNPQYFSFCAACNDPMMNQYNPTASLAWRANMDISPCTDLAAVQGYVAKYCSKEETQTTTYRDIAKSLARHVNSEHVSAVSVCILSLHTKC